MTERSLVLSTLDQLERDELALLSWGIVEGAFAREEVLELAGRVAPFEDPADVLEDLLRMRLVLELPGGGRYRSRFAEMVRLISRLRQLFPRDAADAWRTAPTLVSDYRVQARPRRYPARDVEAAEVLDRAARHGDLSPVELAVLEELLGATGGRALSGFQADALSLIRHDCRGVRSRGAIVCAGTGTGKTLAFYLPALAYVAEAVAGHPEESWTKVVAIYPRNELLKDQLTEAVREARRASAGLARVVRARPIALGGFYGAVPSRASLKHVRDYANWSARDRGFICPFLRCPECDRAELCWRRSDLEASPPRERLVCAACRTVVDGTEVRLTRQSLEATPPDLLFTSTESLNRQLGGTQYRRTFGLGLPAARSPRLVLLDEAHAYRGTHGAQVALLLRRWRHALGNVPLEVVGLSATLRDPTTFFSRLTSLPPGDVTDLSPVDTPVEEGQDYRLALRGDPVSATSLLSTTIQTAMLVGRTLDPVGSGGAGLQGGSEGVFGMRTFAFTDDLDVTNRLFFALLDAEGRGRRRTVYKPPLAALRARGLGDESLRDAAGQLWWMPSRVADDESLARSLQVSRTTSQDSGLDADSSIVVATAALELGVNDRSVGAVIQHKAPRDPASFLQRKGRAGRTRCMRPLTVVVLSDYGRDRLAYQAPEQLFDPVLDPQILPTGNGHILKMQAVYSFMDWVALEAVRNNRRGFSVWGDFEGPANEQYGGSGERQRWEANLVESVLVDPREQARLAAHLTGALGLDRDEIERLLWDPPRALLLAALPTLLRRLRSGWAGSGGRTDLTRRFNPLPDFVPSSLFDDLNLPEVAIAIPLWTGDPNDPSEEIEEQTMPLAQALREFAPGRVSRRFGLEADAQAHWIPLPETPGSSLDLDVASFAAAADDMGTFERLRPDGTVEPVRCVRPTLLCPRQVPPEVTHTSNAFLDWNTQAFAARGVRESGIAVPETWRHVIAQIGFATHRARCPVTLRRFATASRFSHRRRNGLVLDGSVRFTDQGAAAAIGFALEADAIRFLFRLDPVAVDRALADPRLMNGMRPERFRHVVATDPTLVEHANPFLLGWLAQVHLSAITARALRHGESLELAAAEVRRRFRASVDRVLGAIFQARGVGADESDMDRGALVERITALTERPEVPAALARIEACLWSPPDEGFRAWVEARFRTSLAGALLAACEMFSPEVGDGEIVADVGGGPCPAGVEPLPTDLEEIWISETAPGGTGVVTDLERRMRADPRAFFHILDGALRPTDLELVARELERLQPALATSSPLADAFEAARSAATHADLAEARGRLLARLSAEGVALRPAIVTALNARLLRPGSDAATDTLVASLLERWNRAEDGLGIEIDAREFAYAASMDDDVRVQLVTAIGTRDPSIATDAARAVQVIASLLWARGGPLRARALEYYNPFARPVSADRELLRLARRGAEPVVFGTPNWREAIASALAARGRVELSFVRGDDANVGAAIRELLNEAIEVGFLLAWPFVSSVEQTAGDCRTLTLELREVDS